MKDLEMTIISEGILLKIFEAACIQRWNDHVRTVELTELDKHAHKMIIAYILTKYEEGPNLNKINWIDLIECAIYEFFQRVTLTDIKSPIFHKIYKKKANELNNFIISKLENDLKTINEKFFIDFKKYLFKDEEPNSERYMTRRILRAAHYLATNWEFKIIFNASSFIYGINKTKEIIENEIEDHFDLIGVQKVILGKKSHGFIDLCGQLRFQQRWSQTPRLPKTSVLGHMLAVAILSYLFSKKIESILKIKFCNKRLYNNFFGALFHDLPEVLTRDILSPIKKSVEGLDEVLAEIERDEVENNLLPLLPETWHDEIKYFVHMPHKNKIYIEKEIKEVNFDDLNNHNQDDFSPMDGELIKFCDDLTAYIEYKISNKIGIKSSKLEEAKGLKNKYQNTKIGGIECGRYFEYEYDI